MTRRLTIGAAQLGPIARDESREQVVERLMALLGEASERGVELVVFPELALTTFFPRWYIEDKDEIDSWFETAFLTFCKRRTMIRIQTAKFERTGA